MAGSAFFIRGAETQKTHAELSLNIVWKNIIFEMFWEAKDIYYRRHVDCTSDGIPGHDQTK